MLMYFIIPGLLWLTFTKFYYGDIFPNTFYAKKNVSTFQQYFFHDFFYIFNSGVVTIFTSHKVLSTIICFLLSIPILWKLIIQRNIRLLYAFFIYPLFLLICYAVIGSKIDHYWEIYSAKFFFGCAVIFGLFTLIEVLTKVFNSKLFPITGFQNVILAFFIYLGYSLLIVGGFTNVFSYLRNQQNLPWMGQRHRAYLKISDWIREKY